MELFQGFELLKPRVWVSSSPLISPGEGCRRHRTQELLSTIPTELTAFFFRVLFREGRDIGKRVLEKEEGLPSISLQRTIGDREMNMKTRRIPAGTNSPTSYSIKF